MKVFAGMLVLWSAGVGLGALGMLAGVAVRQGWRQRAPRLVAWGGGVQIGSWEDRMRVADQLIIAASRRLMGISALALLQEESNRRQQARAIASMDLMVFGSTLDDYKWVAGESDPGRATARLFNIKDESRRDA